MALKLASILLSVMAWLVLVVACWWAWAPLGVAAVAAGLWNWSLRLARAVHRAEANR